MDFELEIDFGKAWLGFRVFLSRSAELVQNYELELEVYDLWIVVDGVWGGTDLVAEIFHILLGNVVVIWIKMV